MTSPYDRWKTTAPDCYATEWVRCVVCERDFEPEDMDVIHDEKYGQQREGVCRWCPKESEDAE